MSDNRWIISRAGLLNYWYYDEEEFEFSDGRLLLRGSNGSGKSVTMQSFVPLLLDGNKSPERLDPFGSRARKLENYVLGEEDIGKDESIAYLFMEFVKEQSGNYLTIGMGLKAVRGKSLDFWGFSITDGRRIGKDFLLYKNIGEKIPLTQKELRNRIGSGGFIYDSQREYMRMVNELLFGFDELEDYDELVKLLVQLRTPKLSKDFKPTVVYEIMNNSLQPLSEDDLRPMSEAIEHMDGIKGRLDLLQQNKKAGYRLKTVYDQYNRFILFEKAKEYTASQEQLKNLQSLKKNLGMSITKYEEEQRDSEHQISTLKSEKLVLENKKRDLEKHDSLSIKEKIHEIEDEQKNQKAQREQKQNRLDKKKSDLNQVDFNLKKIKEQHQGVESKIKNSLLTMDEMAEGFKFHEQQFLREEVLKDVSQEYNFSYVKNRLKDYGDKLNKGLEALKEEKVRVLDYSKALERLDRVKAESQKSIKKLEQAKVFFEEIKEEYIEKIHLWNSQNQQLNIDNDSMINLARIVNQYGYYSTTDDIKEEVRKTSNGVEDIFNRELLHLQHQRDIYHQQIHMKKSEIKEWESKKDPEPSRDPKVSSNRVKLRSEGIPYIPLYMAVDFAGDMSDDEKGRIEEALHDMGILDALIVPVDFKEKALRMDKDMSDKYLFPQQQFLAQGLGTLLRPDKIEEKAITPQDIDNVLRSIILEDRTSDIYLTPEGEYGFGMLKGKVSQSYPSKYIGSSSRRKYKQQRIEELREQLKAIEENLKIISDDIADVSKKISIVKEEFNRFPKTEDLQVADKQVNDGEVEVVQINKEIEIRYQEERTAFEELKKARQNVHELTHRLDLSPSLDIFQGCVQDLEEYRVSLTELELDYNKYFRNLENIKLTMDSIESIEQDIQELYGELSMIERKISHNKATIESLAHQLMLSNYEEIKEEMDKCLQRLRVIPEDIERQIERNTHAKGQCQRLAEDMEKIQVELQRLAKLYDINSRGFSKEFNLGYVYQDTITEDFDKIAQEIINEYGKELSSKNKEDFTNNLMQRYHETKHQMVEYSMKLETLFDNPVEETQEYLLGAMNIQKRLDMRGRIRGKEVNFYQLLSMIDEAIEENEKILRDSDRQLFEDVLAKNVSQKIRAKIYNSQGWVDKMNQLMESMNTSSGLSFSLSWKSKKAESEDQLDTSELVEILKHHGSLLNEEKLNKLSGHFRSKIAEAKRQADDTGKNQNFHSIMKEILDYRKWFEFRLYFKKTGESKKELTNNSFDKFSGGEKAMAMYVPLFAAVYARYEGARRDCPRIISLDEAFAGVDENNIRDMFRLLNELNLNFVVNSQILWGDYDTVPSLAICELVRPNNADFVTVIRYQWNGRVKELVVSEGA